MKKLVALLLALCLMCGAWTAVAEKKSKYEPFKGETFELELSGFVLKLPKYLEEAYDHHGICVHFNGVDIYTRQFDEELPTRVSFEWGKAGNWKSVNPETRAEAAYLDRPPEGYYIYRANEDIGMYTGEPVCFAVRCAAGDAEGDYYYADMSFFDNDTCLTMSIPWWTERKGDLPSETDIVLLMRQLSEYMISVRPADMSEEDWLALIAEANEEETANSEEEVLNEETEVTLGKVTFTMPAGLTKVDNAHFQSDECEIYLVSLPADEYAIQEFMRAGKEMSFTISYQQTAILLGEMVTGWDEDQAIALGVFAVEEDIGMLNGEPAMTAKGVFEGTYAFYAQTYQGTYFSVYVDGKSLTTEEAETIAQDIMLSARIDGVSEEDMIADAQADYVVITADSGKIRTEPSISGGLIKTAYKGETYELIEQSGDWYVIDVDGRTGYLHSGVAEIQ